MFPAVTIVDMQFTGTLRRWDEGRGFGFIAPTHGGPEIFVHISEFPRDGSRPTEGERLRYEVAPGRQGKPQAVRVIRLAFGTERPLRAPRADAPASKPTSSILGILMLVVLIAVACSWGYRQFTAAEHRRELAARPGAMPVSAASPAPVAAAGIFRCDGRTHCSQMTSCAEATWFINHCPGTQMDGNHDGVPCEQQWCTGPLAK